MSQPTQDAKGPELAAVTLKDLLSLLPKGASQRQDGTDAQLATVEAVLEQHRAQHLPDWEKAILANRLGAYDAGDLYKLRAANVKAARG